MTTRTTVVAIDRFVQFWRELPLGETPCVHPQDADVVRAGAPGPSQLQLDVVPIPVNGCLLTADIILLEANPNFDAEQEAAWARAHPTADSLLQAARLRSLRQDHSQDDYPFYDLDPRLATTGGAAYWRSGSKFGDAIAVLQAAWVATGDQVLRELSWRVAVLQMVPYRSRTFNHAQMAERCASGREVRQLVHALSQDPDKLVICQRRVAQWGFSFPSTRPNVITYDPRREALKASLSGRSRGGPSLIAKLAKAPPRHLAVR